MSVRRPYQTGNGAKRFPMSPCCWIWPKIVFMTRDLVTNDFKLIHSDAVGELNNFRWTTEIYQRTYGTYFDYGVDGVANPDSYGDKAKDYYDNPR